MQLYTHIFWLSILTFHQRWSCGGRWWRSRSWSCLGPSLWPKWDQKKLINNGQKIPPIYSKTCLIRHLSNSILQCYLTLSFIHNLPFIYIFSTVVIQYPVHSNTKNYIKYELHIALKNRENLSVTRAIKYAYFKTPTLVCLNCESIY